jgi:hypothetical protein|tara:strand:+ start:1376 stop:2086 length:711 start_codon:yes stop_codon:yes gene_type:complete
MLDILKRDGLLHITSFASEEHLKSIEDEFDSVFNLIPNRKEAVMQSPQMLSVHNESNYESGKHLRVMPPAYPRFPALIERLNTLELKNLVDEYLGTPNQYFLQIFMSNEFNVVEASEKARNSYLHFDPYPSLKFFLYLTDADIDNGATQYVPGSREVGRDYRINKLNLADTTGIHGGCKHRLEDYTESPEYTEADTVPIIAKRGDLVVIDTDVLHLGGFLKKNSDRKVVIVHNRPI